LKSNWKYPVLSLIAVTAAGAARPAQAVVPVLTAGESVPFVANTGLDNPNFEYNGLYYQLTTYNCSGACGASGAVIEAVVVNNIPQIEVIDTTTPLLSLTVSSTPTSVDITYNFNVWAASTKTTINSATNIVGGTANDSPDLVLITSGATVTPQPLATDDLLSSTPASTAAPFTFTSVSPTSSSVLSVSYDIAVRTSGGTIGDVLKLTNVNLILSPAPEPASIALLATGFSGLVAARRRFKRRA